MSKKYNICNVAVYLGSADVAEPLFRQAVIDLAVYLAKHKMTLVFGGSNTGMMKLLADTMLENKGKVIGVFTKSLMPLWHFPEVSVLWMNFLTLLHKRNWA